MGVSVNEMTAVGQACDDEAGSMIDRCDGRDMDTAPTTDAEASSILHPARLFHSGLVVADIDMAMADLSASLGVRWKGGRPTVHHLHFDGTDVEIELRIAFTVHGPPHIELIEAKEGTIWPLAAVGLHHLCYWSPDAESAAASLEAQGYRRLMGQPGSRGGYFEGPTGLRVEILTQEYYEHLAAWLSR
jgi:catechol 2,3-dioxygenase-like lactoylglutathione lyase family enzyme